MESLRRLPRFGIESLWRSTVEARSQGVVMLDITFVALGFALLALMGVYAHALLRL